MSYAIPIKLSIPQRLSCDWLGAYLLKFGSGKSSEAGYVWEDPPRFRRIRSGPEAYLGMAHEDWTGFKTLVAQRKLDCRCALMQYV